MIKIMLCAGNETFEKLGTIGTLSNLLVYLTTVFHMKSITATTLINVFQGTTNLATLPGAFLCDTYFGRYKTLGFASVSSFLVLTNTTMPSVTIFINKKGKKKKKQSSKQKPHQVLDLFTRNYVFNVL